MMDLVSIIVSVIKFFRRFNFEHYNLRKYGCSFFPVLDIGYNNNAFIDHKRTYYVTFAFIFYSASITIDVKHQNKE